MKSNTAEWHSRSNYFALAFFALFYAAIYLVGDPQHAPLARDELHFWPTSVYFSHRFPPTLEQLRSYTELSTPLPFVYFGLLEYLTHQGLWLGRLTNLLLSLACVLMVLFAGFRPATRVSFFSALLLFACPYYLGVATHLYTDAFALFFVLAALVAHSRGWFAVSACAFACAVSTRQYAVAFSLALCVWQISQSWGAKRVWKDAGSWTSPLVSVGVLMGWIIFFGGPAPAPAIAEHALESTRTWSILPQNSGYFLACVGLYYVLPELLVFASARRALLQVSPRFALAVVLLSALFFAWYPPLGNSASYAFREMGYFDKALRVVFSDFFRVTVFYLFASLTVLRFSRFELASLFLYANAAMLSKPLIAWDKYALPVLCVLWWIKASKQAKDFR